MSIEHRSVVRRGADDLQITAVSVFILWIIVAAATIRDVVHGGKRIMVAPCLKNLERIDSSETTTTTTTPPERNDNAPRNNTGPKVPDIEKQV
jgi:hypothetical protein